MMQIRRFVASAAGLTLIASCLCKAASRARPHDIAIGKELALTLRVELLGDLLFDITISE